MSSTAESSVVVAAATVPRRGRPRRQYNCQHCAKAFKRSEHCIRHERSHTNEKPFICRYCQNSYSRKDLVTRHERTLHGHGKGEQQEQQRGKKCDRLTASDSHSTQDGRGSQIAVAWPPTTKTSTLETPPRDQEELNGAQDLEITQNKSAEEGSQYHPTTGDVIVLSPAPSSNSSLSNTTTFSHRRQSVVLPSNEISRPAAITVTTTSNTTSQNPQPAHADSLDDSNTRFVAAHTDRGLNDASPTLSSIYHIGHQHDFEAMDLNLSIAMLLDQEIPTPHGLDGDISQRPQDARRKSMGQTDQGPTSLFPSSMVEADFDLTGFIFSPLAIEGTEIMQDQPNAEPTNRFQLQSQLNYNLEVLPNPDHGPSQVQQNSAASDSHTAHSYAAKLKGIGDIPMLLHDERQPYPVFTIDEDAYLSIRSDLAWRLRISDLGTDLPSAKICQGFLSSYITSFHAHLPIIHLQTFDPKTVPSPLILAMCSIGSLYRLDRRRARRLFDVAMRSLENIEPPPHRSNHPLVKDYSLWHVQAKVLLGYYAIMSGESDIVSTTLRENGFYTLVFNKARVSLSSEKVGLSRMDWHDWVEYESWKRLLGALLVVSTLTMVMFNVNPGFNATHDLEFENFHDESLWIAESANAWREARTNILKQHSIGRRTLKEVLKLIMVPNKENIGSTPCRTPTFTALVLMSAVVVHMWQRFQISQAFSEPWFSTSTPGLHEDSFGSSLMESAMKSLVRCEAFLRSADGERSQVDIHEEVEKSLVFNSHAVLRIAYIRLFKPISPTSHINLISSDPAEIDDSASSFATAKMERSPQLLDAVAKSFEGFRIPVKLGHLLMRKTAAFRWGVEHAIAGWESALLVTKWVHSVEVDILNNMHPSPREKEFLALIRETLEEAEYDPDESVSLATGLARTWSRFLQDVWIWGITPRMGSALDQLADAYERVINVGRDNRLST